MKERQERKKEMKKNLQNKGKEEGVAWLYIIIN
jgi:hypothetical protein